jgi:hypothetical protein
MSDKDPMAELAGQMVETVVAGQTLGLKVLLAEMQALTEVIPGADNETEADRLKHEAAVEADFDNMPI